VTRSAENPPLDDVDSVRVLNVLGQRVARLVSGRMEPGVYRASWEGTDSHGRPVASGIYFCRMTAGKFSETRRLVLLK